MNKTFHLKIAVKELLTHWNSEISRGFIKCSDRISETEIKCLILDSFKNGNLFLPVGDCDNFDGKKGCLGHKVKK